MVLIRGQEPAISLFPFFVASLPLYNRVMDQEDKCMTYGHTGLRHSLEYVMKIFEGQIVRSKRRKKVLICTACGARDV